MKRKQKDHNKGMSKWLIDWLTYTAYQHRDRKRKDENKDWLIDLLIHSEGYDKTLNELLIDWING